MSEYEQGYRRGLDAWSDGDDPSPMPGVSVEFMRGFYDGYDNNWEDHHVCIPVQPQAHRDSGNLR